MTTCIRLLRASALATVAGLLLSPLAAQEEWYDFGHDPESDIIGTDEEWFDPGDWQDDWDDDVEVYTEDAYVSDEAYYGTQPAQRQQEQWATGGRDVDEDEGESDHLTDEDSIYYEPDYEVDYWEADWQDEPFW